MNNAGLPPLPPVGAVGLEVCNIIQLYMAVWDDLTPAQIKVVSAHIYICADCAHEQQVFSRSAQKIAHLEASSPSRRVDEAVMLAIAARTKTANKIVTQTSQPVALVTPIKKKRARKSRGIPVGLGGLVAAAAVMFVGLFAASHYIMPGGVTSHPAVVATQAFALPTNLSWNGFVLHRTQSMMSTKGQPFTVESYQDLASGRMNIETVMNNKLDVVLVGDAHEVLGMDMMHRVVQWDANGWKVDSSMFDLNKLRQQLKNGQAVYDGKTTFQGKSVYRIRYTNNTVLLLDMDYMPVNVLEPTSGVHTVQPMYNTLQVLSSTKVPESMWSMNVPQGFKPGKLPTRPTEVSS